MKTKRLKLVKTTKANWARFQEIVMESLTELAAKKVPSRKLFILTEALKKAASMTIPLRVLRQIKLLT